MFYATCHCIVAVASKVLQDTNASPCSKAGLPLQLMHGAPLAVALPTAQRDTSMFSATDAACRGNCTCGLTMDTDATTSKKEARSMDATRAARSVTKGCGVTHATGHGKSMRVDTIAPTVMSQVR